MNDALYWMWLSLACTPASATFSKLFSKYSTPHEVYSAEKEELVKLVGSRSKDLTALSDKDLSEAEKILDFCKRKGVGILLYSDERYPENLRKIENPPVLLYYRGTLPDFSKETPISVVGTRRVSDYGRKNAFTVARDLAKSGALIVSGMAIGIDGVAHAAALSEGKKTVAVLGNGIDICYPKEHLTLAKEIVKDGCVFTEYPPKSPPHKTHFPARNRIISALSFATVVIEGTERSGALITARRAKEQGRRVYALPGNVGNKNSEATNLLIKTGASSFSSADDIVADFDRIYPGRLNPFKMLDASSGTMVEALQKYSVSCVAPNDRIFRPTRRKTELSEPASEKLTSVTQNNTSSVEVIPDKLPKEALAIYKKIPIGNSCAIEALIDENISLREVMKILLKLEIGHFITLLPGEKVRRNF